MKRYDKWLEYKTNKVHKKAKKLKKEWASDAMIEAYIYELFKSEWVIYEQKQKWLKMFRIFN